MTAPKEVVERLREKSEELPLLSRFVTFERHFSTALGGAASDRRKALGGLDRLLRRIEATLDELEPRR